MFVYRDRTTSEVRDISVIRKFKGQWTEPQAIYNDQWEINACPVNGPSIAVNNNTVAVIWYSATGGVPKVQLALSQDFGANFSLPVQVDDGNPIGRVDIASINKDRFLLSWVEEQDEGAIIKAKIFDQQSQLSDPFDLVRTRAARRSGFPIISSYKEGAIITWTEFADGKTVVRSGIIEVHR